MNADLNKINSVRGELNLPGDKSISHRAAIFSAMAKGKSEIINISDGDDVKSTIKALSSLGVETELYGSLIKIRGAGYKEFKKPAGDINAGNSGTTARLLSGLLCVQNFESSIIGDQSLSNRPMKRVAHPLSLMGANINLSSSGTLPITFYPSDNISAINYEMPMASAQVKSAILIAGLHTDSETMVIESEETRNHTELMLGLNVITDGGKRIVKSSRSHYPENKIYNIPSDLSTAMFFIVLALLTDNSELVIKNISLNQSRRGGIDVLKEMGGDIEIISMGNNAGEIYGDLLVKSSRLKNVVIRKEVIANIIDEIPILAVAGLFAEGEFNVTGVEELRGKESDRIKSLCYNFAGLGLNVDEWDDGFAISGAVKKKRGEFESFGDHRIAMAFSILSFLLEDGGKVNNFNSVNISNPGFLNQIKQVIR